MSDGRRSVFAGFVFEFAMRTMFGFAKKKSKKREIKNENNRREKGSRGIT